MHAYCLCSKQHSGYFIFFVFFFPLTSPQCNAVPMMHLCLLFVNTLDSHWPTAIMCWLRAVCRLSQVPKCWSDPSRQLLTWYFTFHLWLCMVLNHCTVAIFRFDFASSFKILELLITVCVDILCSMLKIYPQILRSVRSYLTSLNYFLAAMIKLRWFGVSPQCRYVRCLFVDFIPSFSYPVLLSCPPPLSQAFPHSMLQPLAKRVALEKSAGPGGLLNPSVLHYQQALANTPLQPSTALFPTGTHTLTWIYTHTNSGFFFMCWP